MCQTRHLSIACRPANVITYLRHKNVARSYKKMNDCISLTLILYCLSNLPAQNSSEARIVKQGFIPSSVNELLYSCRDPPRGRTVDGVHGVYDAMVSMMLNAHSQITDHRLHLFYYHYSSPVKKSNHRASIPDCYAPTPHDWQSIAYHLTGA